LTWKFTSPPNPGTPLETIGKAWRARYGEIKGHGTVFEGDDGWIRVDRESIVTSPDSLVELALEPDNFPVRLVNSPNQVLNFLECVKSRQAPVSDIESAVKSDAICHVSDVAIRLERGLRYHCDKEKILGDREANRNLTKRAMRKPWKL
jgi:hypothetical protein